MFSQVCLSMGGGAVCPIACWDAHPPFWVGTPRADTSPGQCMLEYDQQAGGTHPTGMQSCWDIFLRGKLIIFDECDIIDQPQQYERAGL